MDTIEPTTQFEFLSVRKYWENGLGVDIGCGTNRLSKRIMTIDTFDYGSEPDMLCDGRKLPFSSNKLDFIFSSHCLEDFPPKEILNVFNEWLRCIKINGYLVLLLPDMEGGRYPKVGDKEGNPSHKVNIGIDFMKKLCKDSFYDVEIVQCDTIPHNYFTLDFVIKKIY